MRKLIASAVLLAVTASADAGVVYHLDLVNASASDLISVEVARHESARYRPVAYREASSSAGGASATISIRKGTDDCIRDLRFHFADGRVTTHRGVDLCAARRDAMHLAE